jgi:hypothetical protein
MQENSEKSFSPRPESGGFRSGCALPPYRSLAPRNRRTHSAPKFSFSLNQKATAFRLLALMLRLRSLRLRFTRVAPLRLRTGRTLRSAAFWLSDKGSATPRPVW